MERSPTLRQSALNSILQSLAGPGGADKTIEARRVIGSLWIAGMFANSPDDLEAILSTLEGSLGEGPLLSQALQQRMEADVEPDQQQPVKTKVRVLADGTYATETAPSAGNLSSHHSPLSFGHRDSVLKVLLRLGFFEIGAVLSLTLAKLLCSQQLAADNRCKARAMLLMTSIIRFGLSRFPDKPIDRDSYDRIMFALRSLNSPTGIAILTDMFVACRRAFEAQQQLVSSKGLDGGPIMADDGSLGKKQVSIDAPLSFSILPGVGSMHATKMANDLDDAINGGVGGDDGVEGHSATSSLNMLSRVVQLTGFSDAIYAETYVTMHHSDIFLDILLVNQLDETLADVSVDLTVTGDLKVLESPPAHLFGPLAFATLKAVVKVCSTCNGSIHGSINYGLAGEEQSVVILPIAVDVLDFVRPDTISDSAFRSQWTLLEWENKINIDAGGDGGHFTSCTDLFSFLGDKMRLAVCGQQNPDDDDDDVSSYLAGNMYAKTIFGEEVLVNMCFESKDDRITGHLRLRSRSQGVAVALGDRIVNLLKPFRLVGGNSSSSSGND